MEFSLNLLPSALPSEFLFAPPPSLPKKMNILVIFFIRVMAVEKPFFSIVR